MIAPSLRRRVRIVLEMIRFSHSVFALPFALLSMLVAADGVPSARTIVWIVLACVFARSAAMAFNRLADHAFDARNPRTADRALPRGLLSRRFVWAFTLCNAAAFVVASGMLNRLCLMLSPVALGVIFGYSYTKRFTHFSHIVLGISLAIAPVGAWLAVRGRFDWAPLALALGVALWTAGFDIIYACQDYEHDLRAPLRSIPKSLGIRGALRASAAMHAAAFGAFLAFQPLAGLGPFYLGAALLAGGLLVAEHALARPRGRGGAAGGKGDWDAEAFLARVNAAFFVVNGFLSTLLLIGGCLDLAMRAA